MYETVFGIYTLVSPVQFSKAAPPIYVMPSGMFITLRLEQSANAYSPISFTPDGKVKLISFSQLVTSPSGTLSRCNSFRFRLVRPDPENACSPISSMFEFNLSADVPSNFTPVKAYFPILFTVDGIFTDEIPVPSKA